MSDLSLQLFGSFIAELDGRPQTKFRTIKAPALLIYLASEPQVAHRREALMTLLWPAMPLESAQTNLRQIVYQVRKSIPEVDARDGDGKVPLILSGRQAVQLNPAAAVTVDSTTFDELMEAARAHPHSSLENCPLCQERLEQAVALYQAPFLADFYLEDSNEFEDWAHRRREAYRRQVMDALAALTAGCLRRGEFGKAQGYARRQLDLDNLDERAYRQMMEALARDSRRHEALAVYEEAVRLLHDELGMSPAAQTTRLAEQIESDSLEAPAARQQSARGYKLLDKIGAGAFGIVHRAYQPVIGRDVVIKIIRPRYANHPDFIRRFEAEAQTIARLEHPYIVPLYDYWREPDNAYLVMRWLRGGNLEERLAGGPLAPDKAAGMVDQVAAALYTAHRRNIVHRDVKAANILLDEDGNAYLSDFSVAEDFMSGEEPADGNGTSPYFSPEQLLHDVLSPQTDQYSLGIVIYQMLTGSPPFRQGLEASDLRRLILNESLPLVASKVPGMPVSIDDVIQRATAKKPGDRFPDMIALARAFQRAAGTAGVTAVLGDVQVGGEAVEAEAAAVLNPYKGLRAFHESDAGIFFGREALVERLLGRIEQDGGTRFLAVVGPSGGGKSSAVKAGLLPAVRGGAIPGSQNWFITEMTPGHNPLQELAVALRRVAVDPPVDLLQPLLHDERGLVNILERILPLDENDETPQLLLLIDQFEELFTLTAGDAARDQFINSLLIALNERGSRLRVVATLRADFYDRPLQVADLGELLRQRTEVVLPLSPAELERAIIQPAALAGVRLEPGLLASITADVSDQPGTLPLMQYALTELFEQLHNGMMTAAAYREIGGVTGALGRRADEIYEGLDPAQQEAARQMFLRLVTLGEGVEDTRRRVLRDELEGIAVQYSADSERSTVQSLQLTIPNSQTRAERSRSISINDLQTVIDTFGRYRLLTFDRDPVTRGPTVEVAHEALLREWPQLRDWLEESRADVRLQRILAGETAEWQEAGQGEGYLLRGARLDQYNGWSEEANVSLTEEEEAFLVASFAARDQRLAEEEARRQRELQTAQQLVETEKQRAEEQAAAASGLRRRAFILGAALGIAALLAIAALFFANQSSQNAQTAEKQAALAATSELQALAAADARATAQFEAEENEGLAIAAAAAADGAAAAKAQAAEEALSAQKVAEEQRSIAEEQRGIAEQERETAEKHARIARSRELAALSTGSVVVDPELAILLAIEAFSSFDSYEARNSLHSALLASRLRGYLPAHDGWIEGLIFSPDGALLATTGDEGLVKIWDNLSGDLLFETPVNKLYEADLQASFNPAGTRLATLDPGDQFNLAIWDTTTWQLFDTIELPLPTADMRNYFVSPDWSQLAVGYNDGASSIWDMETGQQIAELQGNDSRAEPTYSPDGAYLATFDGREAVNLWDTESATLLQRIVPGGRVGGALAFSPDGRWLALIDQHNFAIQLWDLAALPGENDPAPAAALRGHDNVIWDLAFSPDGRQIAGVGRDQTARVWDVLNGNELFVLGHNEWLSDVSFSPDGSQLLTGDVDGNVRSWDLTEQGSSELFAAEMATDWFEDSSLSPDGSFLALASDDGTVGIWDIEQSRRLHLLEGHEGWVVSVDFDPQSRRVASVGWDGTVRVWDVQMGEELLRLEGHEEGEVGGFHKGVLGVAYNPDGQTLATAGTDGTARIWDADTGAELQVLEGHTAGLTNIAYSPDGSLLVTGSDTPDATIKFWDPNNGRELFSLPAAHGDRVWGLDFSPDGSLLATSGGDGTAKIWALDRDPLNAELLTTLSGHNDTVWRVRFSPDGQILATTAADVAYLWDVSELKEGASGAPVPALFKVPGFAVSFSSDGAELFTGDSQGVLRAYVLDRERLLELAGSRVTRDFAAEECARFNLAPCA